MTPELDADLLRPRVLGRPSPAALAEPLLRASGDASTCGYRAEGASNDWCVMRAAAVTGVRHRLAGHTAEDFYAWAHDGERVVAAVADGVGSVDDSAGAAERAARAAVEGALGAGGEDPAKAVEIGVASANRAAEGGGATTVVVAVVDRGGGGAVGRVGDSTAFLIKDGDTGTELFAVPDPERSDTTTNALPAISPEFQSAPIVLLEGSVLVLATDGIADPWRDGPTTVAPAVVEELRTRPGPLQMLRLADFSRQGCHDDRTIVCLWLSDPTRAGGAT